MGKILAAENEDEIGQIYKLFQWFDTDFSDIVCRKDGENKQIGVGVCIN
jgi:hypothetical protein